MTLRSRHVPSLRTHLRPGAAHGWGDGSALLAQGLDGSERACLSHAGRVRALHADYAKAGARVLLTNTFQLNPPALARQGLEEHLEAIARKALQLARLGGGGARVLGDVGPICTPGGNEEFSDRAALARVLAALEGADGILFETCSSPAALSAVEYALHRVPEVEGLPLLLSLSYYRNAAGELVTFSGHRPETFARHAVRHGVAALGVNCGKEIDPGMSRRSSADTASTRTCLCSPGRTPGRRTRRDGIRARRRRWRRACRR